MSAFDPQLLEHSRKYADNHSITGVGPDTTLHLPCPFCAEPHWCDVLVTQFTEIMSQEHVCKQCERGAKIIFNRCEGILSFQTVQTCGEDPPSYLSKDFSMRLEDFKKERWEKLKSKLSAYATLEEAEAVLGPIENVTIRVLSLGEI